MFVQDYVEVVAGETETVQERNEMVHAARLIQAAFRGWKARQVVATRKKLTKGLLVCEGGLKKWKKRSAEATARPLNGTANASSGKNSWVAAVDDSVQQEAIKMKQALLGMLAADDATGETDVEVDERTFGRHKASDDLAEEDASLEVVQKEVGRLSAQVGNLTEQLSNHSIQLATIIALLQKPQ